MYGSLKSFFVHRELASLLLLGALLTTLCSSPPDPATDPSTPTLAIRNTSVFDTRSGSFVSSQTVLIRGHRIVSVDAAEKAELLPATQVLDGQGKFLIPGLIDAHVHLTHVLYQAGMTADQVLPYFLANGVTSVRSTGDNVVAESLLRRWAEENPDMSPRLFLGSWLIGNAPPIHQDIGWSLTSPSEVPAFIQQMSRWGVTTLKIYANCRPSVAREVIEEGHKQGLVVTGHLRSYPVQDAIRDGIDSLEHIESVSDFLRKDPRDRHSLDLESDTARQLVRTIADSGVFVDPTLTVFWGTLFSVDVDEIVNHPDNLEMPRRLRDFWAVDRQRRLNSYSSGPLETRQRTFRKYQDLVGMLHQAGAKILVGTDAPEPQVAPGYSLHTEMELLVQSGMSPASVLQAATRVNAEVLREENHLGSIEPGKLADLVLLRADPLEDIRNTRQIDHVINRGEALRPPEILERRMARASTDGP